MKQPYDISHLQDEHLDMMIRLAYALEDNDAVQHALSTPDPDLTPDEARLADEALLQAFARVKEQQNHPRLHKAAAIARKALPWVINTAACIILLLAMAAPVALANSATFRAKVMQLIMELDEEKGEAYFTFIADHQTSFDVPDGWCGNHFPSYIPAHFTIYDYDPTFPMPFIEYRNPDNHQLFFEEFDESTEMWAGTDNAIIRNVDINGSTAHLIEGYTSDGVTWAVTLVWNNETNWFQIVTFGLPTDEALRVARSVKRIVK